jgi:hypothetical protein
MEVTEYTLIVTKDNLILVNDEEIKGGFYYNELDKEVRKNNVENHPYHKKVIAQSPNIKLSKELADELGWVDEYKLAEEIVTSHPDFKTEGFSDYQNGKLNGFIEGFQKAQELNKNKYSEEDMKTAIRWGCNKTHLKSNEVKVFIQSLQQPKQIKVTYTVENGVYHLTKAI